MRKSFPTSPESDKWVRIPRYGCTQPVPVLREERDEFIVMIGGNRERIVKKHCVVVRLRQGDDVKDDVQKRIPPKTYPLNFSGECASSGG